MSQLTYRSITNEKDSANANSRSWKEQRSIRRQLPPETQRNDDTSKKTAEREMFPMVAETERK